MLRATLVTVAGAIAVFLAAPIANAYSYGQTSCGFAANLARADQAERTATDAVVYFRQNLSNAYGTNNVYAVPDAYDYLAQANSRYQQAKNADDQIRASDEAACHH